MTSTTIDRRFGVNSGIAIKAPVRVATTAAISLSGLQTVDGVALSADDRVLVKNQSDATDNGIWVASTGSWTRASDANGNRDLVKGTTVAVTDGSSLAGTYWYISTASAITVGTSSISWARALASELSTLSFLHSGAGAETRAAQDKLREIGFSVKDFGAVGDGATDDSEAVQAAVTAALASTAESNVVYFPPGTYKVVSVIELNDTAATGNYRRSVRLLGAGVKQARILHRVTAADSVHGRALFQHKLTQTQGDNSSFSRGLEIAHLEIYGDGSTHSAAVAISLEGTYNPWLHDLHIDAMGSGGGLVTPTDSRWASGDGYSCADVVCERVTVVSTAGGYGIKNQNFATAWKVLPGCYIVSNTGGGIYLEGANHHIAANAIAGNGSASGYGLYFARSSEGTPRNCVVDDGVEFDGNYTNQIRTNGINTQIKRVRFKDAASGVAFRSPVQVQVVALTGQSADSNLVEYCNFDFTNSSGTVAVTCVSFDLDVNDGRTVRYNRHNRPTIGTSGAGTTTVTTTAFGTNPDVSGSFPNRSFTNASPEGTVTVGTTSKNIADASTTQVITGLGYRPTEIVFDGFLSAMKTQGYADCSTLAPSNRGSYYYPTGSVWSDTGSGNAMTFRTGAGDQTDGYVSATSDDGFTITWTKTGSPTGTATIKYLARR